MLIFQAIRNHFVRNFPLRFFLRRLFVILFIFLILACYSLAKSYRLHESLPISVPFLDFPTPDTVSEQLEPQTQVQTPKNTQTNVVKSGSPLCRDVTEPWKLVPDPEVDGQYIICNTVAEKMATAEELNVAQNNYRAANSLNILSINQDLCRVAAERAREISVEFSHDGFGAAIERNNIQKSSVGENIASGPLSGVHFVEWSWDKSPGHRENMLGDWTDGCGGVYDRYAVFLFAK